MTSADALRRARLNSGKSLRELAAVSGIAASNLSAIEHGRRVPTLGTVDLITASIGVEFIPVRTGGRATAARSVDLIAASEGQNPVLAYRTFLQLADDLAAVNAFQRVILAAEEPRQTRTRWDDAVAGLVEWRMQQAGAPLPDWVTTRVGSPDIFWEPQRAAVALAVSSDPALVPEPFRRRGVLIEESELASA